MAETMRMAGYLCPACGRSVLGYLPAPGASGSIPCKCGGSSLEIHCEGPLARLQVPCGLCGETHRATCRVEQMHTGEGLALSCTADGQFCCFVGDRYEVTRRLEELEILAAREQARSAEKGGDETAFSDSVIMYETLSELKEIAAREDGITCGCGARSCGMEIRRSSVDLVCRTCGARLRIPAVTSQDLDNLCCRYRLKIPGIAP